MVSNHQKKSFWTLFALEALAKFTIRTLQTSLVLYIVRFISSSNTVSYELTASYGIITYAFPIIAGLITDRYFGIANAMSWGVILMILGSIILGTLDLFASPQQGLIIGLVLLGIGSGFYKPNILALLDTTFPKNDYKRVHYFEKFYLSSSVGDVAAIILVGLFPNVFYQCIFASCLSALLFFGNKRVLVQSKFPLFSFKPLVLIGGLVGVFSLMVFLNLNFLMILISFIMAVFGGKKANKIVFIIVGYASLFFAFVVQCYFALSLVVENLVDRGWGIPSSWFMLVNPVGCLMLGSFVSKTLERFDLFFRMQLGLWMVGAGYLCLFFGAGHKINLIWVAYLFFVLGELSIIPRLISKITHNFEDHFKSQGIGFWYFTMALAQYLASLFASLLYGDHPTGDMRTVFFWSFVLIMSFSFLMKFQKKIANFAYPL